MKHCLSVLWLLSLALATAKGQTWNESFVNEPQNLRYSSMNPTRLADNLLRDFAVADVQYCLAKGKFHAVDQSGDAHNVDAYIGGLRHIGRFDVAGHLRYSNQKEKNQIWNNTLWTNPRNPYIVCDSVPGDATTEAFDLQTTAVYSFNTQWRIGGELGLRTGNRADQTDPRPQTTTSSIPVTIGADFQPSETWGFGVSAGLRHFSSLVDYYNVQPLNNHTYFVMKGMGDYLQRLTVNESGYKREYTGTTYTAALNATWKGPDGRLADFLEVAFTTGDQDARDGGTAYEFRGGDYSETRITVLNRFQFRPTPDVLHNLTLSVCTTDGKGKWSEQKREVDTEHGNLAYYRVLATNTNHKIQQLTGSLVYQLDFLRNGQRNLYLRASGYFSQITRKQLLGNATPKQEISLLSMDLQAGKCFAIHDVNLLTQLQGGYTHPLNKKFATGSVYTDTKDITGTYTRPLFEYESSRQGHAGILIDANMPVGAKLAVGIYATADCRLYMDKEEYWTGFKNKSLTTAQFGAYLRF
ncbi:MAG: hypothetical protein IJT75_03475 [Bacteroidaceae bacterium]|nr:hypothetical protein [Bacteroidaceae bacterium]